MIVISLFMESKKNVIIAANSTIVGAMSFKKSGICKKAIAAVTPKDDFA